VAAPTVEGGTLYFYCNLDSGISKIEAPFSFWVKKKLPLGGRELKGFYLLSKGFFPERGSLRLFCFGEVRDASDPPFLNPLS